MSDTNFLVIDDDEVFSGILARGLTRRGYITHQAHNAEEARQLADEVLMLEEGSVRQIGVLFDKG